MKKFKIIIVTATVFAMFVLLCSCSKSGGIKNNLNSVDMKNKKPVFQAHTNDDSGINNGADNTQSDSTDKTGRLSSNQKPSSSGSVTANGPSNGGAIIDQGSGNNSSGDGNNSSGNSEGGSGNGGSITIGDVTIKPDNKTAGEKQQAEENIRELEEIVDDKYMPYMPAITEIIREIKPTQYGVSVSFSPATGERFDNYVNRLKKKGFIFDVKQQDGLYTAKTNTDMFVRFEVTDKYSLISIYDNAKHFG